MKNLTRRDAIKLASVGAVAAMQSVSSGAAGRSHDPVPVWEVFELTLKGSSTGNPFTEVRLSATFTLGHRSVEVDGFYDGAGVYKVRFMPDAVGAWSYQVSSNLANLDGQEGGFEALPPLAGAHGPVRV